MGLLDLFGGRPIDKFAKLILDEIRRQDPSWRGRYVKGEVTIVADDESGGSYYLARVHDDYLKSPPDEQARILSDIAGRLIGGDEEDLDFETAKPRLRPVIKNMAHVLNEAKALTGDPVASVIRPLVGPLGVLAAVDSERSMTMVSSAMLSNWGADFEAVLAIAKANLAAATRPPGFKRWDEGFYVSAYGDFFDASRFLMPGVFEALPLRGAPVAIVIERSGIAVAGSEEPEVLTAMAEFAEATIDKSQRGIAYTAFILRDGRWQVWDFDPVAFPAFERMRIKQALWDAGEQKAALERHFKAAGEKRTIGDLMVHEAGGRPFTFTQWRDGALTPKADWVVFPGPNGDGATTLAWDDVAAAAGSLERQEGFYPELYLIEIASDDVFARLRDFPSPEGSFRADEGLLNFTPGR